MLDFIADRYQLLKLIGQGGMSKVYLAQDKYSEKDVALKMMHESISSDPLFIRRFTSEIEITKKLDHENIVKILTYGLHEDKYYIIYEYIEGQTIDQIIETRILNINEIQDIIIQILKGLSFAHKNDVIHRDIKPSNIIVSYDNIVKILDFGIAKLSTQSTITKTGLFMGSPQYSSPEQIGGKIVDSRTDIYSLGILLYQMVEGKVPFEADNILNIAISHLKKPAPRIKRKIPQYIQDIIYKCLNKKPKDRFFSADEILKLITLKSLKENTIIVKKLEKVQKHENKIVLRLRHKQKVPKQIIPKKLIATQVVVKKVNPKNKKLSIKLATIIPSVFIVSVLLSFTGVYLYNRNNTPSISNLLISPEKPTISDDIILSYTFTDRDMDSDRSSIKWYINNICIAEYDNLKNLPGTETKAGDVVYAEITPYDGEDYADLIKTEEITIANSIPVVLNIKLSPQNPTSRDNITLSYDYYDKDNNMDKSTIEWYLNDNLLESYSNKKEILSKDLIVNSDIYAIVTPYDGIGYGNKTETKIIHIIGADPNPIIYKTTPFKGAPLNISKYKNYLFIPTMSNPFIGYDQINIIDISDINNPKLMRPIIITEPKYLSGGIVYDNFLFAMCQESNNGRYVLKILDISNQDKPETISNTFLTNEIKIVDKIENYIYLTRGENNISIYNIADLKNPQFVKSFNIKGSDTGYFLSENYLFRSYQLWGAKNWDGGGFQIFDISDQTDPKLVKDIETADQLGGVSIYNNYLFTTTSNNLLIYEISDKSAPKLISDSFKYVGNGQGIVALNNYFFIKIRSGIQILDVSDIYNIREVDIVESEKDIWDIYFEDDFAYVTFDGNGFGVLKLYN